MIFYHLTRIRSQQTMKRLKLELESTKKIINNNMFGFRNFKVFSFVGKVGWIAFKFTVGVAEILESKLFDLIAVATSNLFL